MKGEVAADTLDAARMALEEARQNLDRNSPKVPDAWAKTELAALHLKEAMLARGETTQQMLSRFWESE